MAATASVDAALRSSRWAFIWRSTLQPRRGGVRPDDIRRCVTLVLRESHTFRPGSRGDSFHSHPRRAPNQGYVLGARRLDRAAHTGSSRARAAGSPHPPSSAGRHLLASSSRSPASVGRRCRRPYALKRAVNELRSFTAIGHIGDEKRRRPLREQRRDPRSRQAPAPRLEREARPFPPHRPRRTPARVPWLQPHPTPRNTASNFC